ncbi:hypothetical protein PanWU01x14_008960, partial [Parasponia andersonii]
GLLDIGRHFLNLKITKAMSLNQTLCLCEWCEAIERQGLGEYPRYIHAVEHREKALDIYGYAARQVEDFSV